MAFRLTGWLEETFATQLLLGNHWLQEKNKHKAQGVKSDPEREWRGLYHDSGSCLDITNDTNPERNSYLHIIQARETATLNITSLLTPPSCSTPRLCSPTARPKSILSSHPSAFPAFSYNPASTV